MPHEPAWWYAPAVNWQSALLAPAAALYGTMARMRWSVGRSARVQIPVICVGNFTAGGAGKTPAAIAVARAAQALGERPMLLTRGYGGTERGPRQVDAGSDGPARVGDEALLLARVAPTIVARDRVAGARQGESLGASLLVMDDGFQNPSLAKDLSVVVVDAAMGVGNGRVIPAGPLRAPLAFQLDRADALLVVGSGPAAEPLIAAIRARGRPVLRAILAPMGDPGWAQGARVVAFAGIGRPERFFATLEGLGATLAGRVAFADHHPFTSRDAERLLAQARAADAMLVTTEKDWLRLAGDAPALRALKEAARPLPVGLQFDDPPAFERLVRSALAARLEGDGR